MTGGLLNINSGAVVVFTNKLEKISKNALPRAAQQALSKTAFDVKKSTMPASAKSTFVQRKPTFFKSASTVEPAKGLQLNSMRAVVGFKPVANDKGRAVEDLEQQEYGGTIGGRAFIPLKQARAAKSWHKNVKKNLRIAALKEVFDSGNSNLKGKNGKENFAVSAIYAKKGGLVMSSEKNSKGNKTVSLINSIKRVGGDTKVNSTPVYSVRAKRKVHAKPTHFMREATDKSADKMERFYIEAAEKQLKFYTK